VVIHDRIHHLIAGHDWHGLAAGNDGLELATTADAARHLEQLRERRTERDLEVTRALDVAGHGEDLRAARLRRTHLREPLAAIAHDRRNGCEALGIVDRRRLAVEPEVRRERRLEARHALLALEGLEQRGLFAADVGAGAEEGIEVKIDGRAEQSLAEIARVVRFLERLLEAVERLVLELAADVVVTDRRADRVAADRHTLDNRVRVVAQDVAVLAGAGFGFVRIADDVLLAGRAARHEAPFEARREARAATTAKAGRLDDLDHLLGRLTLAHDALPRLVAAEFTVVLERPRLIELQGLVTDLG